MSDAIILDDRCETETVSERAGLIEDRLSKMEHVVAPIAELMTAFSKLMGSEYSFSQYKHYYAKSERDRIRDEVYKEGYTAAEKQINNQQQWSEIDRDETRKELILLRAEIANANYTIQGLRGQLKEANKGASE